MSSLEAKKACQKKLNIWKTGELSTTQFHMFCTDTCFMEWLDPLVPVISDFNEHKITAVQFVARVQLHLATL